MNSVIISAYTFHQGLGVVVKNTISRHISLRLVSPTGVKSGMVMSSISNDSFLTL